MGLSTEEMAERYRLICKAAQDPDDIPGRAFNLLAQTIIPKPDPISAAFDTIESVLDAVGDFLFGRHE